ncbi:MAG: HupE/UreJ family protein [Elainellaceae cyanobacterium]
MRSKSIVSVVNVAIAITALFSITALAAPAAFAHHAMGGGLPATELEGFISGLAHPIIGLDHFAFVVAIGLLAATKPQGPWLPIGFVLAALAGTALHLLAFDLPVPEIFISVSVLVIGVLLTLTNRPRLVLLVVLSAIAGLFHGYAYGESIIGAEPNPLVSYLLGFTTIQLGIAAFAFTLGKWVLANSSAAILNRIGFVLCGAGAAFLSTALLG